MSPAPPSRKAPIHYAFFGKMPQENQSKKNHLSPEDKVGVPNQEDLEAAMKANENEVSGGTPKLTSFSAVIDEVMPQIHEQIALRVRRVNCPIMIYLLSKYE